MEVQRQAGIVFAHACLNTAEDSAFVLSAISLDVKLSIGKLVPSGLAGEVEVAVARHQGARQSERQVSLEFVFSSTSKLLAVGTATVRFIPRGVYQRLRPRAAPAEPNVPPESHLLAVNDAAPSVDFSDPIAADHEVDHVPAMAIVSSIERTVMGSGNRRVGRLSISFERFLESQRTASLEIDEIGTGMFEGRVRQHSMCAAFFRGQREYLPHDRLEG